jgi:hypothetical protein
LEKHIRMSLPNDICPNDIANDIAAWNHIKIKGETLEFHTQKYVSF